MKKFLILILSCFILYSVNSAFNPNPISGSAGTNEVEVLFSSYETITNDAEQNLTNTLYTIPANKVSATNQTIEFYIGGKVVNTAMQTTTLTLLLNSTTLGSITDTGTEEGGSFSFTSKIIAMTNGFKTITEGTFGSSYSTIFNTDNIDWTAATNIIQIITGWGGAPAGGDTINVEMYKGVKINEP